MSLLAVLDYVETLLIGVTSPLQGPAQIIIGAPSTQVSTLDQPAIVIWGTTQQDDRATMGRPNAERTVMHAIYLWLKSEVPSEPGEEIVFPPFVEGVKDVLRFTPVPVDIWDPVTGEHSSAATTGETFHVDSPPPLDVTRESYRMYEALIQTNIQEWKIG